MAQEHHPSWSISQTIAWIVTGNEEIVSHIPDLSSLDHLPALTPNQFTSGPPTSAVEVPHELLKAWDEGQLEIYGRKNDVAKRIPIPRPRQPFMARFVTANSRLWLEVREDESSPALEFWTSLWIPSEQCKARWPTPLAAQAPLTSPGLPTYPRPVTYAQDRVPEQFTLWAKEQHDKGIIVTFELAEDAMRGPKDSAGTRAGGLLRHGVGLSRTTIRKWVEDLPEGWQAKQGVPPSRVK
jgi:hypothetical protein